MSTRPASPSVLRAPSLSAALAYRLRILRVLSRTEFKLKYAGSVLGYFWSLAKPLLYFTILWVVFGHLFKTNTPHFPIYLLIGIVLYTFLADAVALALPSILVRGALLRRIAFPSIVVPTATTLTSAMTFLLNCVVVVVFVLAGGIEPRWEWLMLLPLILEFYAFVLGIALIFSSLYVRFRDVGQIWEVLSTVLLYSSAVMYPLRILPGWARHVVSFDPLVQVTEDARLAVLGGDPAARPVLMIAESRLWGIGIALLVLVVGIWLHRRESPRFPELA